MYPKVSVIVCTYNRERYLGTCLEKLQIQSADQQDYEVILVNNNSTDSTEKLSLDFITTNNLTNFRYYNEKKQGLSHSRNRGIQEAKGEIITFIDDDAFADEHFITNISFFFRGHEDVLAIGGRIIPVFEGQKPKWMSKYLMPLVSALDMGQRITPFKGRKFPIGANMSFRRDVFDKYGLFNVNLGRKGTGLEGGEEKEIFLRIKRDKKIFYYVPGVLVNHIISPNRTELDYIKRLADGVGTSERKRLKESGWVDILKKIAEESVKTGGTLLLSFFYFLKGKINAGWMLIKFRYWVIKGLILGK